ncbi:hypothetical protein B0A48_14458 [Cryoendolithus antarcticus]|uniref:DUF423 domain-containing protein n=1 Tax=Cryoendolithus antarcticus TaxID=1507870 RepID=A0A1V8SKL3_9PEZI|nr:hypothetical protein B0A48_14458 [Cryoendolithus antarcticus]OQO25013.1 hypothetical protein B0A51_07994 [Rachicladosporium sp. CCFEE 5018]OQO28818.1 hypothetical protein B0A51_04263 [Rachicladosporium sp. CCFEE 5018]
MVYGCSVPGKSAAGSSTESVAYTDGSQLVHSAALLAVEAASPGKNLLYAKSFLLAGMTLFSGSIYLLVLDPQRFKFLGPVTPIGGLALIAGWGALAVGSRGRTLLK